MTIQQPPDHQPDVGTEQCDGDCGSMWCSTVIARSAPPVAAPESEPAPPPAHFAVASNDGVWCRCGKRWPHRPAAAPAPSPDPAERPALSDEELGVRLAAAWPMGHKWSALDRLTAARAVRVALGVGADERSAAMEALLQAAAAWRTYPRSGEAALLNAIALLDEIDHRGASGAPSPDPEPGDALTIEVFWRDARFLAASYGKASGALGRVGRACRAALGADPEPPSGE